MILDPEWHLVSFVCTRVVVSLPRFHPVTTTKICCDRDLIDESLAHDWFDVIDIV